MTSERKNAARRKKAEDGAGVNGGAGDAGVAIPSQETAGTTGRYLVLLRRDAVEAGVRMLSESVGAPITSAADFEGNAMPPDALAQADAIVFPTLGVAVVNSLPEQLGVLSAAAGDDSPILAIEEERIVYAFSEELTQQGIALSPLPEPQHELTPRAPAPAALADYLRGYQDAVNNLVERLLGDETSASESPGFAPGQVSEGELTWGLQATNVPASRYTGRGVRVAVLDTGFDLGHPDFVGRPIVSKSFVQNQEVQDGHGHGTHCVGTACGPLRPGQLPRYGVAYEAEIYVGKVLSNQGSGSDSGILAGIEWAINNGCAVISMSLGAPTRVGQSFSRVFEAVARRALAAGTLIIAAAGNESRRPSDIRPVGHPANCPSIIAVAALDQQLSVASFSCGGLNPQGGQVDIAGPGVAVRSSWPRPRLNNTISGTSMATPHVAGIAALHAQANPDMRGGTLGWLLLQSSRRLTQQTRDVGVGLVQAP